MPAMRGRAGALVVIAGLGLAACGGSDAAEEAVAPVPAAEGPRAAEPEEGGQEPKRTGEYWSNERLAGLEASKKAYVAPTPAPPADAGDGGEPPAAVEPASSEPVPVAAGEATPVPADRHRIAGHVDVPDHVWLRKYSDGEPKDGDKCRREQQGYEDVAPGTRLEVSDGTGATLATGKLGKGTLTTSYEDEVGRAMDCRLPFTIDDVPAAETYTIALKGRGDLTYSFADLERQGWTVGFSIDW